MNAWPTHCSVALQQSNTACLLQARGCVTSQTSLEILTERSTSINFCEPLPPLLEMEAARTAGHPEDLSTARAFKGKEE